MVCKTIDLLATFATKRKIQLTTFLFSVSSPDKFGIAVLAMPSWRSRWSPAIETRWRIGGWPVGCGYQLLIGGVSTHLSC